MSTTESPLRERYLVPGVLAASVVLLAGLAMRPRRGPRPDKRRPDMPSLSAGRGVHVERTVTIRRPPADVYRLWRDLERLPAFVRALESVTVESPTRSRWRLRGPARGLFSWEAEIVADREGEMIAWRSRPGSRLDIAGSIQFRPAPAGRGTELRTIVAFSPRGWGLGTLLARLTAVGDREVREGLRQFKQLVETGEVATTSGQPSGRRAEPEPRARRAS
jgi:uncharacterized membrane protein